ncbi:MAG: hypothetical protein BroJett015_06990 [Chloroflexota bacterium]|nr:acetyltransferase [Ardenticatenaceae bacterium]GIK55036.1 MAG: hypothetical protein BroJett015_06990 [Chloroflexota bacterium]
MNKDELVKERLYQLATAVRDDCFAAAVSAYENASMDGLCHDGAWECALDAMRSVNFEAILHKVTKKE